jgi:hypothetical protein
MKFTNNANLPEGIVRAIIEDEYTIGNADYSHSKLAVPPQMARLMSIYSDEITVDVSDEIWKLLGKSVHYILEKANKPKVNKHTDLLLNLKFTFAKDGSEYFVVHSDKEDSLAELRKLLQYSPSSEYTVSFLRHAIIQELGKLTDVNLPSQEEEDSKLFLEKRLYLQVGNIRVSGQIDWYKKSDRKIEDYKVTSVWKILKNDLDDWEFQGNVYKLILENNGFPVDNIQINTILKDWKKFEAGIKKDEGYPQLPVHTIEIKLWKPLDVLKEVIKRIEDHELVKNVSSPEELYRLRPCTDKEKWHGEDKFAVMKHGGKKASAVFNTLIEAEAYMLEKTDGSMFIEIRKGEDKRCEEYCLAKPYCAQYKAEHSKLNNTFGDKDASIILPTVDQVLEKLKPPMADKSSNSVKETPTEIPTETIGNETYPLPPEETIPKAEQKIQEDKQNPKPVTFDLNSYLEGFKK